MAYPEAHIGLLVQPALAPLASLFTPVDSVLEASPELVETLREFAPDAAVCISRGSAAPRALRRAGVRHVAGTGRRWFSFLFDRSVRVSRRATLRHELEHALDLGACAGAAPGPLRFPIEIPQATRDKVDRWLLGQGLAGDPVVVHPGSAGSCPGWAATRWRRLADRLREAGQAVVVTEGPTDRSALEPFADSELPRFAFSLPELAALLSRSRLTVSNSTGPIHLAAALGRATLAIHAPWNSCGAARWGPYAGNGWALVVEHEGAKRWSRRRRRRSARSLMDALPVETVLQAVLSMCGGERVQKSPEIGR
ncbi:MAG: hypothetical protein GTO30_13785 [Acidobacteria bacterium]|nr:hypothetical protein [Acidobacteriota bacterium]NIM62662.1 hypothetical protein [Acidobacteriota bacterium]NIO59902.1 hypothetical protein [Acidobacteriota bacterium]NIQ86076.1 hypothetical protein [Acidobacteriota bacterium]NIT11592.1 hypothetical protein [Acidobacteriota bacterium]